jgi:hypothetical protein
MPTDKPTDKVTVKDLYSRDPEDLVGDKPALMALIEYYRGIREKFAADEKLDRKAGRKKKTVDEVLNMKAKEFK